MYYPDILLGKLSKTTNNVVHNSLFMARDHQNMKKRRSPLNNDVVNRQPQHQRRGFPETSILMLRPL
jgi:hypothetical protein